MKGICKVREMLKVREVWEGGDVNMSEREGRNGGWVGEEWGGRKVSMILMRFETTSQEMYTVYLEVQIYREF